MNYWLAQVKYYVLPPEYFSLSSFSAFCISPVACFIWNFFQLYLAYSAPLWNNLYLLWLLRPPPYVFLGSFGYYFLSHTIYVCIICLTCHPILSFSKVGSISDFYLWTGHRPRAVTLCAVEAQYVFIKWRNNESLSFVLHQEFCTNNTSTLSLWRGKL